MDAADARGEPVVSATGGVTLQKRLDTREFDRPTVVYELDSQRDAAVDARLIDPIPAGLESADIGFLGVSDGPTWGIKGPKLVFEQRLDAGGTYRTGVAARGDRAGAVTDLLEAPEVLDVDRAPPRHVQGSAQTRGTARVARRGWPSFRPTSGPPRTPWRASSTNTGRPTR